MFQDGTRLFHAIGDLSPLALQSLDTGAGALSSDYHLSQFKGAERDALSPGCGLDLTLAHQAYVMLLGALRVRQGPQGRREALAADRARSRGEVREAGLRRRQLVASL